MSASYLTITATAVIDLCCPVCGGPVSDRRCCLQCEVGIAEGSGWPMMMGERDYLVYAALGDGSYRGKELPRDT